MLSCFASSHAILVSSVITRRSLRWWSSIAANRHVVPESTTSRSPFSTNSTAARAMRRFSSRLRLSLTSNMYSRFPLEPSSTTPPWSRCTSACIEASRSMSRRTVDSDTSNTLHRNLFDALPFSLRIAWIVWMRSACFTCSYRFRMYVAYPRHYEKLAACVSRRSQPLHAYSDQNDQVYGYITTDSSKKAAIFT